MSEPLSAEYYEALERRLRALDGLVARLVEDLIVWYREYLDVGEYGLAVEVVAERLTPDMPHSLASPLAEALLAEAELMTLTGPPVENLRRVLSGTG